MNIGNGVNSRSRLQNRRSFKKLECGILLCVKLGGKRSHTKIYVATHRSVLGKTGWYSGPFL